MICPHCGHRNVHRSRFCNECGARFEASHNEREAERRQLTVLFCDMVAYTPLARALELEDLRDLVAEVYRICAEEVHRTDGHVAQYLGDGVLAYFGFPLAHEDDPLRAIDAGLAIVEALRPMNERLTREHPELGRDPLRVRVGIHTGAVVVGELGTEHLAVGETVNLAARLEAVAEPESVVISAATARLAEGFFELTSLGAQPLKGIPEPVLLYRVLRRTEARNRVEIGTHRGLTPFVGRWKELARLREGLAALGADRRGSLLHVCGEAGMGKSRLIQHFHSLASSEIPWLECACSPHHRNTALHPLISMLERELRFPELASGEERFLRLESALSLAGLGGDEAVPLLAGLLSLPVPDRHPLPALSGDARRRRTLDALLRWLLRVAERSPTVLVVEDLHWADPSSLEILDALARRIDEAPLLVVTTARPEFGEAWPSKGPRVGRLELEPLLREEVESIVAGIAMGRKLPPELGELLVSRTDGVPLFVEELAKSVFESLGGRDFAAGEAFEVSVPSTLEGSLQARLDRLGEAKAVAQVAAAIGRAFSRELVTHVHDGDGAAIEAAFARLIDAGLILPAESGSGAEKLQFKHALVQEAAYRSLLRGRRRDLHGRIARALEQHFPAEVASQRETLAYHYEQAHEFERAVEEYRHAGEGAMERSAHREAVNHFTRAIELLNELPESAERDAAELDLQVALGTPLQALRGFSDARVERTFARARELCRGSGDPVRLFQARSGLFLYYQTRADLEAAAELAVQMEEDARRAGDPYLRQWVHLFHGVPLYYWGRFREATEHLERAVALYDPSFDPKRYSHEQEPGVAAGSMAAMSLWVVGQPELGLLRSEQAIERGRRSRHPYNLAFALAVSTSFHFMRREPERVRERAEEVIRVAEEQGFPVWRGMGLAARAWADAVEGNAAAADRVWEGIGISARTGMQLAGPLMLSLVADAQLHCGNPEGAAHAAESALALSRRNGDHFWDAEVLRIQGEALRVIGSDPTRARACFDAARRLARGQAARAIELRVLVSSLRAGGEGPDAIAQAARLTELLREFSGGDETRDLIEARELLATSRPRSATQE